MTPQEAFTYPSYASNSDELKSYYKGKVKKLLMLRHQLSEMNQKNMKHTTTVKRAEHQQRLHKQFKECEKNHLKIHECKKKKQTTLFPNSPSAQLLKDTEDERVEYENELFDEKLHNLSTKMIDEEFDLVTRELMATSNEFHQKFWSDVTENNIGEYTSQYLPDDDDDACDDGKDGVVTIVPIRSYVPRTETTNNEHTVNLPDGTKRLTVTKNVETKLYDDDAVKIVIKKRKITQVEGSEEDINEWKGESLDDSVGS